jgi:hypothetical protein
MGSAELIPSPVRAEMEQIGLIQPTDSENLAMIGFHHVE